MIQARVLRRSALAAALGLLAAAAFIAEQPGSGETAAVVSGPAAPPSVVAAFQTPSFAFGADPTKLVAAAGTADATIYSEPTSDGGRCDMIVPAEGGIAHESQTCADVFDSTSIHYDILLDGSVLVAGHLASQYHALRYSSDGLAAVTLTPGAGGYVIGRLPSVFASPPSGTTMQELDASGQPAPGGTAHFATFDPQ